MGWLHPLETAVKSVPWNASRKVAGYFHPAAVEFAESLLTGGYMADRLIDVLPQHKLLYIQVPKAASTSIRSTLARIEGRRSRSLGPKALAYRGPYGPRSMTVASFYRLATSPHTLRFSFVRNPYSRTVACWAQKYRGKPLVPGEKDIDIYLAFRKMAGADLPAGKDRTLSFAEFVAYAAAAARMRHDAHIQVQDDMLSMPGIKLDLIGKTENFDTDFAQVLDHVNASGAIRREATAVINKSEHEDWRSYYTHNLADRIYRTYECDFDRFKYARWVPS